VAYGTQEEQQQALREFERAYQRDPQYADALGWAAVLLEWMAQGGAPRAFYDSAGVLARRALAIDPAQAEAVDALGVVETFRGRAQESRRLTERAASAFPSSAPLHRLLVLERYQAGDSAGAVEALRHALVLAPRSSELMLDGARAMLALRRYDDVRDLLARARALEGETPTIHLWAANLASALGDTAGVVAAMHGLHAANAMRGALGLMRFGDRALQDELASTSLASMGATTVMDSVFYYRLKAQLFLTRGEAARARALMDSGFRLATLRTPDYTADAINAGLLSRFGAWFAAGRGDRAAAMASLRRGAADPAIPERTGGMEDADQTCRSAEVYGLLDDVEAMVPLLRRCLTMPNGYPLARLGDAAFARHQADPRMRALLAELAAARARSAPRLTG
jgi:Tfp pilus assembly protein PilF